jgi:hypothetical protein
MTINSELYDMFEADCLTYSENFRFWASLWELPTVFDSSGIFARMCGSMRRLDKKWLMLCLMLDKLIGE